MQIIYKIWKIKDIHEKVLKVTCNLQEVLNKSVKSIKGVLKVLESVQKSPLSQKPNNANKLTACNKTPAQNQRRLQNRREYYKYLQFHNIN